MADMGMLGHLMMYIGALSLIVVVGTFVGILLVTVEDIIAEREQERERSKWRTKK